MKSILFVCLLIVTSCKSDVKTDVYAEAEAEAEVEVEAVIDTMDLEVYDFDGLQKFLNFEDDKVYVVNFWATWCAPCIKELPYFEEVTANYSSKNVEVILVSLDFPQKYESKLKPFIVKHKLKSKVIALDDVDSNTWIPKVSKDWSGSIPATIIYSKEKRQFYERSFNYTELETEIKQFLN